MMSDRKRKRGKDKRKGRPPEKVMPERIDASPEHIAEVVLGAKPKQDWRYLEDKPKGQLKPG